LAPVGEWGEEESAGAFVDTNEALAGSEGSEQRFGGALGGVLDGGGAGQDVFAIHDQTVVLEVHDFDGPLGLEDDFPLAAEFGLEVHEAFAAFERGEGFFAMDVDGYAGFRGPVGAVFGNPGFIGAIEDMEPTEGGFEVEFASAGVGGAEDGFTSGDGFQEAADTGGFGFHLDGAAHVVEGAGLGADGFVGEGDFDKAHAFLLDDFELGHGGDFMGLGVSSKFQVG
jgi:hypothetical protein